MATPGRRSADPLTSVRDEPAPRLVVERLFAEGAAFDFFQAVRLLQRLAPDRARVGIGGPPLAEAVRFRALGSLCFPASTIHDLSRPAEGPPVLTQAFLGLTGPNGVLPRHYTELLIRLEFERRDAERHSFRDWLDLFNHRFASLFYRAWEKYRLFLEADQPRPRTPGHVASSAASGPFEASLLCLVGLGTPALRNRLTVAAADPATTARPPVRIDDATLIFYAGLILPRTRSATGLEAILRHYFGLNSRVVQFVGRWLSLAESSQSRLGGEAPAGSRLGVNTVIGERVWDVQGFFRVQVGPLTYPQFRAFLPDQGRVDGPHSSFLMARLIRFYVGAELDFDIQLVLKAAEVPRCLLPAGGSEGPILGWNSWLANEPFASDADDAAFSNVALGV